VPDDGDARYVLAVDLGTGGPKVGLVSTRGELAAREHVAVATRRLPDGGAVQDAGEWWEVVRAATRRLVGSGAVEPSRIVAVSCTGQWASTVPVDAAGVPVGDCLLWLDTRGGRHTRAAIGGPVQGYAPGALLRWIRHTAGVPSLSGADPVGHMLALEHDLPEVAAAARWYLEPVDYLTMRFCGVAAATHASMAGAWLTDNRDLATLAYDPALVAAAGVPGRKLPALVPFGTVVGDVLAAVADDLGLPPGVAVVAGTPDLHSAAAGSGAVLEHQAHLTLSTSSWVSCPVAAKKTDGLHQIATVPGLSDRTYLVADNHDTGGRALEWAGDTLFAGPRPAYEELTALAATVAPGAGGVVFTPWLAGERSPVADPHARGGFHNLSLRTTTPELLRAVLEGVAFNSRWLTEAVERFVGRRLPELRMLGGGATSARWCQIHADVLDRTVVQVADPVYANLRGAALLAGLALGDLDAHEVRGSVPVAGTFHPDPATRATYDHRFAEFPRLYRAQKGLFRRLNHLAG
jgi:xylulokinase